MLQESVVGDIEDSGASDQDQSQADQHEERGAADTAPSSAHACRTGELEASAARRRPPLAVPRFSIPRGCVFATRSGAAHTSIAALLLLCETHGSSSPAGK